MSLLNNEQEASRLKIKLKETLLKFTLDGSLIEVGSEFEVAETYDDWTFPDNPIPMYTILEGEYAGKFLHRFYCKVIDEWNKYPEYQPPSHKRCLVTNGTYYKFADHALRFKGNEKIGYKWQDKRERILDDVTHWKALE
jgi:hypothetical protein